MNIAFQTNNNDNEQVQAMPYTAAAISLELGGSQKP